MKFKPYSSVLLTFEGFLLMALGIYFMFWRPPLLPEDLRYMKITAEAVKDKIPGFPFWMSKVFLVMGSYILTTGLLMTYFSCTSLRKRTRGGFSILAIAGMTSIGSMTVINFIIASDFKWLLLIFVLPWAIGLILYLFNK